MEQGEMCWEGVELGVNEGMSGFQSGCSSRPRDGVLGSCDYDLDRKASSATRMDVNMFFLISEFVPSFSEKENTMEEQRDHDAKEKNL